MDGFDLNFRMKNVHYYNQEDFVDTYQMPILKRSAPRQME